ncbi:MAG TPA: glycosyltransferase 87 family protein [Polyangiales bacterium]|nr:glycosyltransferase 87 family protein [Polyangiales bacterium]
MSESGAASAPETVPSTTALKVPPRSHFELSRHEFATELGTLRTSALFWAGCLLKLGLAVSFGSHFATRWFAPFAYTFVHSRFQDPWAAFLAAGEPMAFPYGPGMLAIVSLPFAPALLHSFDPASHLGLFLLRVPLFLADLAICLLLMRWLRLHARDAIVWYWLSPIVLYATYIHGQLDLIPTALLCMALFLVFARRTRLAGVVFGFALATKLHLLVAFPFVVIFLWRQHKPRLAWLEFVGITTVTALALYAPVLESAAFRRMVFGSAEADKVWTVSVPYGGNGLVLYLAPAMLLLALLRFATYRKLNRELTLMFIGALYVGLVALVPPQPGWFIWSIPFAAYLSVRFSRTGRFALLTLSGAYLAYFFVGDPLTFLEAFDPLLGPHFGAHAASTLAASAPILSSPHAASVAWTFLFAVTALAGSEMYRKGVRSNAVYRYREQSFMIGVGGDSGAGKHTVANDLAAVLGPQLGLIDGDDDHKWERGHAMWRRYTHLDPRGNLLHVQLEALASLRRGAEVRKRRYDHDAGRFTSPLLIKPSDFVAIVGLHPFYLSSQRELLELKVFVDPDEELRRQWKVERDMQKRGYAREQVLEHIEARMPDSIKYVRPQMKHADVVLRMRAGSLSEPHLVHMEVELASALDPLSFVDALDALELDVVWTPDEELTRDKITIRGQLTAAHTRALVFALLPNADELVHTESWQAGGRGIALAAVLHAISVRMRNADALANAI